jgi:hypothetical protein
MIDGHITLALHVEEYQRRLRDTARTAHIPSLPHQSIMKRKLGRLIIRLGERVQGECPSPPAIAEPAKVQLATH